MTRWSQIGAEYALADAGQRVADLRSPWNTLCVEEPR